MTDTDSAGRAWDWQDDADDVIVRGQSAIACYLNPAGDIVLRQHGDYFDEDAWIWFAVEQAPAVAAAIIEAAGLDATALAPEPTQKPKDTTAAGRQRRYRKRKKKEPSPEPDIFDRDDRDVTRDVTDRDTVTGRDGATA